MGSLLLQGCNSVLHSAKRNGDLELFKSILYEMRGAGIDPDKYTYSAIANVAFKSGGAKDLQVGISRIGLFVGIF